MLAEIIKNENVVKNDSVVNKPGIVDEPRIVDKSGIFTGFLKKFLIIFFILGLVFYLTKDLYYLDFQKGCYIGIVPSAGFAFLNSGVKRGLQIVKRVSPEDYINICQRVSVINTNYCHSFEGGCFEPSQPRTIYVYASSRDVTWVAEVISHEACHARQGYEKRSFSEDECHKVGLEVMQNATVY